MSLTEASLSEGHLEQKMIGLAAREVSEDLKGWGPAARKRCEMLFPGIAAAC